MPDQDEITLTFTRRQWDMMHDALGHLADFAEDDARTADEPEVPRQIAADANALKKRIRDAGGTL